LWWWQFALVFRSNFPRLTAPAGSGRLGWGGGWVGGRGVFEQGGKRRRKGLKRGNLERMEDLIEMKLFKNNTKLKLLISAPARGPWTPKGQGIPLVAPVPAGSSISWAGRSSRYPC
jgi:hypothetical protein